MISCMEIKVEILSARIPHDKKGESIVPAYGMAETVIPAVKIFAARTGLDTGSVQRLAV